MVGSVAAHLSFTNETSLSLYQKNFLLDRYLPPAPIQEVVLIPEFVEEKDLSPEGEAFGYNRWGKMNRASGKGLLIDSYF
jgi:hypothetical protein